MNGVLVFVPAFDSLIQDISIHLHVRQFPRPIEERRLWAVETKQQEEIFAAGGYPVRVLACRGGRAEVDVGAAVSVHLQEVL